MVAQPVVVYKVEAVSYVARVAARMGLKVEGTCLVQGHM